MTTIARPAPAAPVWRPRTELNLVRQQLRAIDDFHQARRAREAAARASASNRELRLDAARQLEVLRRQRDALVAHSHDQLCSTGSALADTAECRVVLAHRSEWFLRQVAALLEDRGVRVVGQLDNGADVVGVLVAEQPDLVLVEDALPMGRGDSVVGDARVFAPDTLVAVQAAGPERLGRLLDAGAGAVFSRATPPRDVSSVLLDLLGAP